MDQQHQQMISELERASILVLADPAQVSPEQRHDAEQIFLKFHRATSPYNLCRTILETCQNDYVLFQAASVVKLAVAREWPTLDHSQTESLRVYLLEYVVNHPRLAAYVREQCVQAIAVIYKRGCLEQQKGSESVHNQLFSNVAQLIHSGSLDMQVVACSILTALLNEFSATSSASSIGLPWEFHRECKVHFEQADLKLIFTYCLQTLSELSQSSVEAGHASPLLSKFLSITEQILNWDFLSKLPPKFLKSLTSSSPPAASFRPPESWKDVILDRHILDMMFTIHRMIRGREELCNQSVQCLVQLASMNGTIFSKDEMQIEYLTYFIDSLLKLLSSVELYDHEALGVANIINSLVQFSPLPTIVQIRSDCLSSFLSFMAKLTCSFCQAAAKEEASGSESACMEAFEMSLDSWRKFVSCANELPAGAIRQHAVDILDNYLRYHLSPPAGVRQQLPSTEDDEQDDDRDKFSDQLFAIGSFARHVPEYSLPLLTRLLNDRISVFEAHLRFMQQGSTEQHQKLLDEVNEDLHWLLLVTADTLTDSADGETIMIPADIMEYSLSVQNQSNEGASGIVTLQDLVSLFPSDPTTTEQWQRADPVIRLISSVFRLSLMEQTAADAGLTEHLSPQVGQSLMRLLARWTESYLVPNEAYYSQISLSILSSFGQDAACTVWTTTFLLDKVLKNLCLWNFEPDLVVDTLTLLTALVEKQHRCDITMKCDTMWSIVSAFSSNQHPFNILPPSARRQLCRALVFGGSANFTPDQKQTYMQQVFQSLEKKFEDILRRPDLKSVCHKDEIKNEVISLYDSFSGVAEAATPNNGAAIFTFLSPKLFASVDILDLYHNYEEVVQLVLETFSIVSKQVICYISEADCTNLYKATVAVLQVFVRHNIGKRCMKKDVEEERYTDLMTLMQILTNILSKDFISFCSGTDSGVDSPINAADVAVYGLAILIPLMTDDLLMFPHLSSRYMNLVAYMSEIHPAHVCQMPDETFNRLLHSVEFSLTRCSGDVVKSCLELITHISTYIYQNSSIHGSVKHSTCKEFLRIFFTMLLGESFDTDLIDTFSPALFTLICCHQEHYKSMVNALLNEYSTSPHHQRLVDAFNRLTDFNNSFQLNRSSRITFSHKFNEFLVNVRGFLCVR